MRIKGAFWFLCWVFVSGALTGIHAAVVQFEPSEFDFGWVPEGPGVRVSASAKLKNISGNTVTFDSQHKLDPDCPVVVTGFQLQSIPVDGSIDLTLSLNTRGYPSTFFKELNRIVSVKTVQSGEEVVVATLKSIPKNPDAKVFPGGPGLVEFLPTDTIKTQVIAIQNLTSIAVTPTVVQPPANWVTYQFSSPSIPSNGTVSLSISVSSDLTLSQQTSMTFEAMEGIIPHRFTVVIRTGTWPKAPTP